MTLIIIAIAHPSQVISIYDFSRIVSQSWDRTRATPASEKFGFSSFMRISSDDHFFVSEHPDLQSKNSSSAPAHNLSLEEAVVVQIQQKAFTGASQQKTGV